MRPIPVAIQLTYPSQGVPARPWWRAARCAALRVTYSAVRSDRVVVEGATREELLVAMADRDESDPLPHPLLRAGQVWAGEYAGLAGAPIYEIRVISAQDLDCDGCLIDVAPRAGSRTWLLADPVCPWLAPWGSP